MKGGELCDATVHIISAKDKKAVGQGRTYAHSKSNPKTFTLSPGLYIVSLKAVRSVGDEKESFEIEVLPGESQTKMAEW